MLENITRREKLKGTDPPATYANRHTLTISPEIACSLVSSVMAAEKDASEAIRSFVATLPNINKLKQVLLSFVSGHDVVDLLPTGFGNSLIFQLRQRVRERVSYVSESKRVSK